MKIVSLVLDNINHHKNASGSLLLPAGEERDEGIMFCYTSTMLRNSVYNKHKPKIAFAKELRKRQTPGEKSLWRKIRSRKFHGLKFRRQVPIGPFIVDFLCSDRKLIIEIDGWTHGEPGAKEYDERREEYLRNE